MTWQSAVSKFKAFVTSSKSRSGRYYKPNILTTVFGDGERFFYLGDPGAESLPLLKLTFMMRNLARPLWKINKRDQGILSDGGQSYFSGYIPKPSRPVEWTPETEKSIWI